MVYVHQCECTLRLSGIFLDHFLPIPPRQHFSLNPEWVWWPARPSSPHQGVGGVTGVWDHGLTFYLAAGDSNSGLHPCTASVLIHWTISQAQHYIVNSRSLRKESRVSREAFITSWKLVLFVINEKPWLRKWDWNTILSVPSGLPSLPQKREISTGEMTWHFDAKVRGTNFEGPKVLKDVTRESLSPSAAQSLAHSRGYANIWSAAEYVIQRFLPHLELSFKAVT